MCVCIDDIVVPVHRTMKILMLVIIHTPLNTSVLGLRMLTLFQFHMLRSLVTKSAKKVSTQHCNSWRSNESYKPEYMR